MALRLLEDKIAIIPIADPDKTKSGLLWIPDEAKQRIDQGIVKYRAPGVKEIKVGDHVFFSGYDGTQISLEGEGVLFIMREEYVKAVFEGTDVTLFPLQEIERIIELCHGELNARIGVSGSVSTDEFKEIILNRFRNWFFSEGLKF